MQVLIVDEIYHMEFVTQRTDLSIYLRAPNYIPLNYLNKAGS